MNETIESQLLDHLETALSMERDSLRMIDDMIFTIDDPEIVADFKRHKQATYRHVRRLEGRMSVHERNRSIADDVMSITSSIVKAPLDLLRSERHVESVSDAYASEHAEIAEYELLERIADMVGDRETARVARENREDEQDFVKQIEDNWDRAARESLADAGVIVVPSRAQMPSARSSNGSTSRRSTGRRTTSRKRSAARS